MTQAFNLALFANKLNTSGQTDNTGLQNSSVTVTAGTGMSGGGAVALGSSITLTNAGVTSIVAGTGISVSSATGSITISNTVSGGVTSLNGQTGAITNTTIGNIGSIMTLASSNSSALLPNATVSGANLYYKTSSVTYTGWNNEFVVRDVPGDTSGNWSPPQGAATLTGTWRCVHGAGINARTTEVIGGSYTRSISYIGLFVRVS